MQNLTGSRVVLLTRDMFDSGDDFGEEIQLWPGCEGTIVGINYIDQMTGEFNIDILWDAGGVTTYSEREIGPNLRLEGGEILGKALTTYPEESVRIAKPINLPSPRQFVFRCRKVDSYLQIRVSPWRATGVDLPSAFTAARHMRRPFNWVTVANGLVARDGKLYLAFRFAEGCAGGGSIPFQRFLRRVVESNNGDGRPVH